MNAEAAASANSEELPGAGLDDPYLAIIVDAARRRGIAVAVLDAEHGYLRLERDGRSVVTRGSLSELTSAVAMSRCDDKQVTHRVLSAAGLAVPRTRPASFDPADEHFLQAVGRLVVKPARGEQGEGVTVGVASADELARAREAARAVCPRVLLEQFVEGQDLRVVVIDHQVVAAAVRRPAEVVGDGQSTIRQLVERRNAQLQARSGGELTLPLDDHTAAAVRDGGHDLDDVLARGERLAVRRTANLHTGGTMHDVTDRLHHRVADACVLASRALDIPVVGLDLIVPSVDGADHVFIEANERPGLANHEPQPTAERFIDLLFPQTAAETRERAAAQPPPAGGDPRERAAAQPPPAGG
ncbi:MAG TPA: ATP-grasp domain-containing protein, partial [Egibacteraceae bacterium]|nr:ATP-grasp domain-containing protein [Egibacteraceae bacterium]